MEWLSYSLDFAYTLHQWSIRPTVKWAYVVAMKKETTANGN